MVWGAESLSRKRTRQGGSLSKQLAFYAIFTSLIISILSARFDSVKQVWLADDASAPGLLQNLLKLFRFLQDEGTCYGYYANAKRS